VIVGKNLQSTDSASTPTNFVCSTEAVSLFYSYYDTGPEILALYSFSFTAFVFALANNVKLYYANIPWHFILL